MFQPMILLYFPLHYLMTLIWQMIPLQDIISVEAKWKDWSLQYSTAQTYGAVTGWKTALSHSIYIRWPCYNRPVQSKKVRRFAFQSVLKDCNRKIKKRPIQNDMKWGESDTSKGKLKSFSVLKDGINVIISKANLVHTCGCQLSWLQQVMQILRIKK